MKYRWLLFDLDNTLLDFDRAEAEALRRAFAGVGMVFDAIYAGIYKKINDAVWLDYEQGKLPSSSLNMVRFERLLDEIGLTVSAYDFSQNYQQFLSEGAFFVEGAERLIQQLQSDHQLAIITNGLSAVQRPRLKASLFAGIFEPIVISSEVGVAKPNAGIFDLVFAGMSHPPKSEVLIIGDSLTSDMAGGINYGIDTCWFNPQQKIAPAHITPRYQIQQLAQLLTKNILY